MLNNVDIGYDVIEKTMIPTTKTTTTGYNNNNVSACVDMSE